VTSPESHLNDSGGAPAVAAEELRRLRRELAKERAKLARRQADRERIANLEKTATGEPGAADASRRLVKALQRRLDDAVLLDGDDAALASRVLAVQTALEQAERGVDSERTTTPKSGAGSGANDRTRQRQRQKIEEELREINVACDELLRAAAARGVPPEAEPFSEDGAARDSFAEQLAAARGRSEALAASLALRARALRVQRLSAGQALRHLEHCARGVSTAELDALCRDVRREVQRALADLDRHLTVQWPKVHAELDRLIVQRIRRTEATPEIDTSFETLAFRAEDLELLGAALRLHLWPMIETVAQLLPQVTRAAFAKALARIDPATPLAAGLDLSMVTPLPANVARSLLQKASSFDDVGPLGRVAVPPGKLFRRGERLVATGRMMQQVSRMPMMFLGPTAGLSFVGFSLVSEAREYLPLGIAVLVLSAFFAPGILRRRAWLEEQVLLERGRAALRESLRKRGAEALQALRKVVADYLDASIERLASDMRAAAEVADKKEAERLERRRARLNDSCRDLDATIDKLDSLRDECDKLRQRRIAECQRLIDAFGESPEMPA
jgi:hypothetical protein